MISEKNLSLDQHLQKFLEAKIEFCQAYHEFANALANLVESGYTKKELCCLLKLDPHQLNKIFAKSDPFRVFVRQI